jgi:hypothetical protein
MSATTEIVPSVLDRIRRTLVGLKMPRALEVLDQTMRSPRSRWRLITATRWAGEFYFGTFGEI